MLVSGNWGPYDTFKILAIISKNIKPAYHMVPKLDDNGDEIPMKMGKRANGKGIKEQRVMMDTYQEYYINNLKEVESIIKSFAVNAAKFDYKSTMDKTEEELTASIAPLPLEKATNLQIVE